MAYCTVKEAAEKCGVTPQGVNKYLRTSGLREQCKQDGNRFLIPETVQKLLETHFDKTPEKTETVSETNGNPETKTETVSVPWEVYEDLRKQLDIKDKQIADLSTALVAAQQSLQAAQMLHGSEKAEKLMESGEEKTRRPWWRRWGKHDEKSEIR